MLETVLGHSDELSFADALDRVLEQCAAQLSGRRPRAGLLFTSHEADDYAPALRRIQERLGPLELAGCTGDGEWSSSAGLLRPSTLLALFCSDTLDVVAGAGRGVSRDAFAAARAAADQARGKSSRAPALAVALPDGLTTAAAPLADALNAALPGIMVTGGTAGDGYRLQATHQFCNDEVLTDGLALLLFCGDLEASCGCVSGWEPLGRRMTVTASRDNVVRAIDGRPALEVYRQYLGDGAAEYSQFPLAVFEPGTQGFTLRDPLQTNQEEGSIAFIGVVPQGSTVQFTETGGPDILAATRKACADALAGLSGPPAAALVFSCTSRRIVLGSRAAEELAAVRACGLEHSPLAGFSCYGEICPLPGQRKTRFHNDTFVITLLRG